MSSNDITAAPCDARGARHPRAWRGVFMLAATIGLAMGAPAFAVTAQGQDFGVVGAHPAPPTGPGAGTLAAWEIGARTARTVHFGKAGSLSGNSFLVAFDPSQRAIFVPTEAGRTYVLDAATMKPRGSFDTLKGGRVAGISPDGKTLVVLSGKAIAGYALPSHKTLFQAAAGGNALAFAPDGKAVFVGGNMDRAITEIALADGKTLRSFPVARSGDLAYADGRLFSADMKTGRMMVIDPASGKVWQIQTPEHDPAFKYSAIPAARAGFMQIAADPQHHRLYAAGFSGHILEFRTDTPSLIREFAVPVAKGANKLSGLTLIDHGRRALVTAENHRESAVVDLASTRIVERLPGVASNRWVTIRER